ncbi:MAG: AAA family ATPase, partial [Frankiaceae bacterium]
MNLPYVGRAAEMRGLHRALEEARRGQTVAVFVSGEAGVGKSRLISEFAAEIAGGGVIELTGTCLDVGEDAPLWPVADVLGRLLRGRQSAATIELLRPWWGQLKRLLPM